MSETLMPRWAYMRMLIALVLLCWLTPARAAEEKAPEVLVGAYYFSGWWEEMPNKYHVSGQDWRERYPGRIATLGEYNTQKTMDREIVAASAHAVSFFQFLWYFQGNKGGEAIKEKLNDGIKYFTTSPENERMRFTVECVNHTPFGIFDDKAWEASCREWIAFFKHPRYLKVDGKAIFKVHGVDYFRQQCGGNDKARGRLAKLREIARAEGAGELLISGGVMAGALPKTEDVEMYDFLTTYMDVPAIPKHQDLYAYSELLALAQKGWKSYGEKSPKPYVPCVPAGWDPRPWRDSRPSFALPEEREWLSALLDVRKHLDRYPMKLGVPAGKDQLQKMILIYAWNEFAEGGFIAPTQGDGGMKLNVIQKVFGQQ